MFWRNDIMFLTSSIVLFLWKHTMITVLNGGFYVVGYFVSTSISWLLGYSYSRHSCLCCLLSQIIIMLCLMLFGFYRHTRCQQSTRISASSSQSSMTIRCLVVSGSQEIRCKPALTLCLCWLLQLVILCKPTLTQMPVTSQLVSQLM